MNAKEHHYQDLITLFNTCFATTYNTQLVRGTDEPIYLPTDKNHSFNAIYFAHGFFSSALHECAHWLIAGKSRRKLVDYGYWYVPDGRTPKEQALFQQVEVKPQALEWILSRAAGYQFQFSIDNLNGKSVDIDGFKQAVYDQVIAYCKQGLSKRANLFRTHICHWYQTSLELNSKQFTFENFS